MRLVYPAVFIPFDDGDGYTVEFPDLPGCVTEGEDLGDAIYMAEDAASGWILTELENGAKIPDASKLKDIKVDEDGAFTSLIVLNMDEYARKYGKKAVKKTLTIPAWMDTYAAKHNISCSEVLKDALEKMALA